VKFICFNAKIVQLNILQSISDEKLLYFSHLVQCLLGAFLPVACILQVEHLLSLTSNSLLALLGYIGISSPSVQYLGGIAPRAHRSQPAVRRKEVQMRVKKVDL